MKFRGFLNSLPHEVGQGQRPAFSSLRILGQVAGGGGVSNRSGMDVLRALGPFSVGTNRGLWQHGALMFVSCEFLLFIYSVCEKIKQSKERESGDRAIILERGWLGKASPKK